MRKDGTVDKYRPPISEQSPKSFADSLANQNRNPFFAICVCVMNCVNPSTRHKKYPLTSTVASPTRRLNASFFSTTTTRSDGSSRLSSKAVAAPLKAPPITATSHSATVSEKRSIILIPP